MSICRALLAIGVLAAAVPAQAQRAWLEAGGPHVTVVSDAGERRARSVAWQFEQMREVVQRMFPWIRVDAPEPLVVLAARNEASMRALAPQYWENGQGGSLVSVSKRGPDRHYVLLRADIRIDDREGINPYQAAYWAYCSTALRDTSTALPTWLVRGLASFMSNTLVREGEVQVGRVLPQHLQQLRSRSRVSLKELVSVEPWQRASDRLDALDAHAWAFVHFLVFGEKGARAAALDSFVSGVLSGADPATTLSSTIGDVSRLETPFSVYLDRDIFGFVKVDIAARITREGFSLREMSAGESAALRASFQAAMGRPEEARALIAEADKAGPEGIADEARALLAEAQGRDDELLPLLERAVTRPTTSWYAPFRLATRLPTTSRNSLERVEALLVQATGRNASADTAWAFLGEVQAGLGRGDTALTSVQRAMQLAPASAFHRVSLAHVLHRLDRQAEALRAAGTARALARTPAERDAAQQVLTELAKAANEAAPAPSPSSGNEPTATSGTSELAAALAALEPACSGGSLEACRDLAEKLLERNGPGDVDRARVVLRSACEAGDQPSCTLARQLPPGFFRN